jgi:hypothetical protein
MLTCPPKLKRLVIRNPELEIHNSEVILDSTYRSIRNNASQGLTLIKMVVNRFVRPESFLIRYSNDLTK